MSLLVLVASKSRTQLDDLVQAARVSKTNKINFLSNAWVTKICG